MIRMMVSASKFTEVAVTEVAVLFVSKGICSLVDGNSRCHRLSLNQLRDRLEDFTTAADLWGNGLCQVA
jgi:hypothetical protein